MRAVIRADASAAIGTGHLMRCLALASELAGRGWRITFVMREVPAPLATMAEAIGDTIRLRSSDEEPAEVGSLLARRLPNGADVCITDGYEIGAAWHREARSWARRIMAIDDLATTPQGADLLLNQNLGVDRASYRGLLPPEARMLIGPRFAIVRPEFAAARRARPRRDGRVSRVLVFISGADVTDVTRRAAEACVAEGLPADVVIGPAYPHARGLADWALQQPLVHVHANVGYMGELMRAADLAIGAPSSASWERCTVGLPAIVVSVAENQRIVERELVRLGAAYSLGWHDGVGAADIATALRTLRGDAARVADMGGAARRVTDGRGATRVAREVERLVARDDDR